MAVRAAEREVVPEMDFREIISINVRFLRGFGIIKPEEKSTSQTVWYFLRAGAIILALTSMVTSEVANMFMVIGDLEKMAEGSFLPLTHFGYGYKLYSVYKYENKVTSLINSLNRRAFQPKSSNQYQSLKSYIRDSKIISKIFLSAPVCICIFWAVYPFIEGGDVFLPLVGWFPFDTTCSPAFEITFVYQIVVEIIIGLTDVSLDTFISGLIMVVCAQLNILNDSLKNMRKYAEMELDDNGAQVVRMRHGISPELQKKIDEKLVQCIIHHRSILEFADEIKFLFTYNILGQFVISIAKICVIQFEIMLLPWTSIQFFSLLMYQLCMLLEIFLLCYYGNEVILESTKLTTFAYYTDWTDCSAKYKRNLLLFMTRSQRDLTLYAGGFIMLSLETFVKILKASWSCFTFLNTVHSDED